MKCSICKSDYADAYFKNKDTNEIICDQCLLESDCMSYETTTSYYLEGEFMGDTDDYESLLDNVAYALDYEEIKDHE